MSDDITGLLLPNGNLPIYTDGLSPAWGNFSWASHDPLHTANTHTGTFALWLDAEGYSAFSPFYLNGQDSQSAAYQGMPTASFDYLRFWIHRGDSAGGQTINVRVGDAGIDREWGHQVPVAVPVDNNWHEITIPLRHLDARDIDLARIQWSGDGTSVSGILLDDMEFVKGPNVNTTNPNEMVDNEFVLWLYRDMKKSTLMSSFNAEVAQQLRIRSVGEYGIGVRMTYYGAIVFRPVGFDFNAPEPWEFQQQTVLRLHINQRDNDPAQEFAIYALDRNNEPINKRPLADFLPAGVLDTELPTWQILTVPLVALQDATGVNQEIHGVAIQEDSGVQTTTGWLFLDEVRFEANVIDANASSAIYDDALGTGWSNASWNTVVNMASVAPVQTGTNAISVTSDAPWGGLYLYRAQAIDITGLNVLSFNVRATGAPVTLRVHLVGNGDTFLTDTAIEITPTNTEWTTYQIPVYQLGAPTFVKGIVIQDYSGSGGNTYHVDNVSFDNIYIPPPPPEPGPVLTVDATTVSRSIDPHIYGMNFSDEALSAELRLPVRRWGGNGTTRYNWKFDTKSHTKDWYFENIPVALPNPTALPEGSSANQFIEQDIRTGTETMMTMPMIGWSPKERGYLCGFSVSKYGPQQSTDPWRNDCGNGIRLDGSLITGNDPTDTSMVIGPAFVTEWMQYLVAKYGLSAMGGIQHYSLDNEPFLWHDTHRDVHPAAVGYDEIRDRTFQYAPAIKAVDPNAKTFGPALWGWSAYFYSALDQEPGGAWYNNPLDRNAHGGTPFIEWYLQQMASYEASNGTRILDYLDLHFYPAGSAGGTRVFSPSVGNTDLQALRLRSTKALFDTSYVDESWINEPTYLIPRMKAWTDTHYPGTKTALTEYNWGALNHINGALAQADILGIFGQEGLDLATLWDPPSYSDPGAYTFRMFRNYDGSGGEFGDRSVASTTGDWDRLSIYSAIRTSDSALTVIVVNKTATPLSSALTIAGVGTGPAQRYQYAGDNQGSISHLLDVDFANGSATIDFPAQSITTLVVPVSSTTAAYPDAVELNPTTGGTEWLWPPTAGLTGNSGLQIG